MTPEDAPLLRSIRLDALTDAPEAFGSTYEREVAFTDDIWRARLEPTANPHFVDEADDGTAQGLVAGLRVDGDATAIYLVAMWVAPHARGEGAADRLLQQVVEWATTEGATVVRLHVMDRNRRAKRVYERNGFRRTGRTMPRDRDGLIEIEMERRLE